MCSIIKCFGQREVSSLKFIIFIDGGLIVYFVSRCYFAPNFIRCYFLGFNFEPFSMLLLVSGSVHPNPGPNGINSVSNGSFKC